jgi:hypothetical protein
MEFQGTAYRHRLLMLLDEFPSLGRLAFFEGELPYLAGYGIKCFLIAQSLNQIEKAYGANNAILDNCHIRVTYNALDERTAKRISDLLGQATLTRKQRSFAGGVSWLSKVSHSEQEVGRPLLMPDEILRLPYDEALLMVGGLPPYHAKKIMYYLDARFRDRAWRRPPESARARAAELPRGRQNEDWPMPPEMPEPEDLPLANEEAATDVTGTPSGPAPAASTGSPSVVLAPAGQGAPAPEETPEPTLVTATADPSSSAPGSPDFVEVWDGLLEPPEKKAPGTPPRDERGAGHPKAPTGVGRSDNHENPGDV